MDLLNFYTLIGILFSNLVVFWWIFARPVEVPNRESIVWSHGLWTATWLAWLLAWVMLWSFGKNGLIPAVVLEDIGAIMLIGSSVAFMGGWPALKKYAPIPFVIFVVVDVVWLPTVIISTHWTPPNSTPITNPITSNDILTNTILFAPSLCLVVFAIGFVAWSFLHLSGNWDLSISMLLLAAGYALFQVIIYQANLFNPGMMLPKTWDPFLLVWRLAFVLLYWFSVLAAVGVGFPLRRALSKAGWLAPVLATALIEHVWK